MSRPLVTVVVPLYNGARYVTETLTSVQQQTVTDFEVIVVDDGSTDDGAAVVGAHPLSLRLVRQEQRGVAVARNRGLLEARGRWITFLDQDDLWHHTRLERLLTWLDAQPGERLVATTEVSFDTHEEHAVLADVDERASAWDAVHVSAERALAELHEVVDVSGSVGTDVYDHRAMLRGPVTVTTSFIADPDLLRLAGGFAPHALAMDDYWLLVNAARLSPLVKVDQPTAFYRLHAGATTLTTRLALPFLSSAAALRLGGVLLPTDEGLRGDLTGPLHEHLLRELAGSSIQDDVRLRRVTRHLAGLLWADGASGVLRRADFRRRFPRAAEAAGRIRARLHRGGAMRRGGD